jgi:hypothetical protein
MILFADYSKRARINRINSEIKFLIGVFNIWVKNSENFKIFNFERLKLYVDQKTLDLTS